MAKVTKLEVNTTQKTTKKLKVAAYCRVSSGSEAQLESLETQKEHYATYIASRDDWEFAGLYYDKGITGRKKESRLQLLQLLDDCKSGKINFILTKSISRFSRNTADCLELVRKLLELKIPVYFEKENINTGSMESELFLSMLTSMAQDESDSISQNALWAMQKRFKDGTYKITCPPYGYSWDGEKIIVNVEQALIVKRIFQEYLNGKGSYSIAKGLNAKGVLTKKKGTWNDSSILFMLKNEFYTGTTIFQKHFTDLTGKRQLNTGQKDKYVVEDHHTALISKDDFAAVAIILENNLRAKNSKKNPKLYAKRYAFSGKLQCANCGKNLGRLTHASTTHPYIAWGCPTHIENSKKCSLLFLRDDTLKLTFVTVLNKLIYAHQLLLKPLLDAVKANPEARTIKAIQGYQLKLLQNTEQRETLTKLMAQGYIDQVLFTKENNELLNLASTYRKAIEALHNSKELDNTILKALNELWDFTETSSLQTDFKDELFSKLIDKVTIKTRTEAIFHFKCGLNLKERIRQI